MIFLVQILVNLFRYNTRLAAFYNARADVLELAFVEGINMNVGELAEFIRVMSPDNLDFGKSVRSPVEEAVEISRNLASTAKAPFPR
ncbi:wyosine [tRNA(Phe)-imidazoG37] synthetase (radical SAM superfamily) [Roseovarius sp. MBR-154]|jgi:wyosine [tRNA(Phe)-imidazoG37] synthetase (radical SAM superfamily)